MTTGQAIVDALLVSIGAVSVELADSISFAGLKRAEDVEWYPNGKGGSAVIDQKRAAGRQLCAQLSIIFGVPIIADMFGEFGYTGDRWMGVQFQIGGTIPLG